MGITVRHDPSPASMFRVARRAAESDVAEQRRQEALRQQQINAEMAARKAAQDAGFQQQREMFGLERDARADYREDVQKHEVEGWQAQATRIQQQADAIAQRQADMQAEADARFAEQRQDDNLADMMTKPLPRDKFVTLRALLLGIRPVPDGTEGG